jgi:UTP--glucose-1-phosphate uridylyltransferase
LIFEKASKMTTAIKKAIFPVAGLGTRFLPATKANPKEMLPIVDKPLIQYAVEEAIAAGINELIFVTSSSKRAIEDHFDSNFELESKLQERGNEEQLSIVRNIIPAGVSCAYIRQTNPLGLGHAVLCAKNLICNEPFAVLLADELIDGGANSCLSQVIDYYQKNQYPSIVGVQAVPASETHKYGIVGLENKEINSGRIKTIVEKPKQGHAPSNLAVVGRYILHPHIFNLLEKIPSGAGNEIQLTDAISRLLLENPVYACELQGKRYDCGSKLGYLKATINYALQHAELAESFKHYLKELAAQV